MFGVGLPELIVILVVALVVLGPEKLPEVARSLGRAIAELRRHTSDILEEFQINALLEDDRPRRAAAARAKAMSSAPAPAAPVAPTTQPAGASPSGGAAPAKPEPERT